MFNLLSSHELRFAIDCEENAARGQLTDSIARLSGRADETAAEGRLAAATWLRLKVAELWCSDCNPQQAWALYEQIRGDIKKVPNTFQTTIQRNFSFVGVVIGRDDTSRTFYESVDRATADARHGQRAHSLLVAEDASRKREHYDSIPALWRDLKSAYMEANWPGRKRAHERLAVETVAAGWINPAVHHSVHGGSKESLRQLATWLLKWRRIDLIRSGARVALRSVLRQHAQVAAEFIGELADVLPDDMIGDVMEWSLRVIRQPVVSAGAESAMTACCETLLRMHFRFSSEQAKILVDAAINHPFWDYSGFGRKPLLALVRVLIEKIDWDWGLLADKALPIVVDRRFEHDYQTALDLLVAIGTRDVNAKTKIADALLPRGTTVSDLHLLERLGQFGRTHDRAFREPVIRAIACSIPEQVKTGQNDPGKPALTAFGSHSTTVDGQRIHVAILGGQQELALIASFGEELDSHLLEPLIAPVLQTIQNTYNSTVNRSVLLDFLFNVHQHLSSEQAATVCGVLLPFADGRRCDHLPTDEPQDSTVSRFRMRGAPSVAEQQGTALIVLTAVAAHHDMVTSEIASAIDSALVSPNATLRRLACSCLSFLAALSSTQALCLSAFLQDRDESVVCAACEVIVKLRRRDMLGDQIPMIVTAARYSSMSESFKVRYAVAHLLRSFARTPLPHELSRMRDEAHQNLCQDLHYHVRLATSETEHTG